MHSSASLLTLFGRFHPLLVHLPIGGLILLACLELCRAVRRKAEAPNSRWMLGFVVATALASAICGWLLSSTGGYDSKLVHWHRNFALAMTASCVVTFLLQRFSSPRAYAFSLSATVILLAISSHLGGSITHGTDFLTRYLPKPSSRSIVQRAGTNTVSLVSQPSVFVSVIEPILRNKCYSCHGPEKHKADLRLDAIDMLLKGGLDGPIIKAGRAQDSALISRLLVPLDGDGRMPPDGSPQLSEQEIDILEWWVNAGAPFVQSPGELGASPKVRHLLEAMVSKPMAAAH
jgi:hypothetical protein